MGYLSWRPGTTGNLRRAENRVRAFKLDLAWAGGWGGVEGQREEALAGPMGQVLDLRGGLDLKLSLVAAMAESTEGPSVGD